MYHITEIMKVLYILTNLEIFHQQGHQTLKNHSQARVRRRRARRWTATPRSTAGTHPSPISHKVRACPIVLEDPRSLPTLHSEYSVTIVELLALCVIQFQLCTVVVKVMSKF